MDSLRLGDVGKQPQSEILFDHEKRPKTARRRDGESGADCRGNRAPVEAGRPGVETMIHFLRALAARLRELFGDRRADRDLDDEIETHLRLLTERYVHQGMTEAEAARAARRQFGNVTLLKEEHREMRGIKFIESAFQDVRYGLWTLRRNPGFALAAVLTLSLGIGANTAIFSVVNGVLLGALPYPQPDRLAMIWPVTEGNASYPIFVDWRDRTRPTCCWREPPPGVAKRQSERLWARGAGA